MSDQITAMPAQIVTWLTAQTDTFTDVRFLTEFPATPKATPLRQTIVSVGIDNVKISDFFVENSDGELVPSEYCRLAEIRLRFSIYVPYSSGGTACHEAFTKIVDCLNFESDLNIKQSECGAIEADRDTDAFVMKSYVDVEAEFCPAETSSVQYRSLLPKTLFCGSHIGNDDIHVTTADKTLWNAPFVVGRYFGTDSAERTFNLGFKPKFVVVSITVVMPVYHDPSGNNCCGFGLATPDFASAGLEITANGFKVLQGTEQDYGTTLSKLNKLNMDYFYVAFK